MVGRTPAPQVRALLASPPRLPHAFLQSRASSGSSNTEQTLWPLLQRRTKKLDPEPIDPPVATSEIHPEEGREEFLPDIVAPPVEASLKPIVKKEEEHVLALDGLSTNLKASDFYRLSPADLSSWQSVITKVQQKRHHATLEPTGRYHLSFASASAASSYRDRLLRLHRLSRHRLLSPTGLWQSIAPSVLRPSPGSRDEDLDAELSIFTVVPACQPDVAVRRVRAMGMNWEMRAKDIVRRLGHDAARQILLLVIYPPTFTADSLQKFIEDDAATRGGPWQISAPYHLERPSGTTQTGTRNKADASKVSQMKDYCNSGKLPGRFVITTDTDDEAQRFYRSWNQRTLNAQLADRTERYVVNASVIRW